MRTCDYAPRTEDSIKSIIKTKLFKIFEKKLQKLISFACSHTYKWFFIELEAKSSGAFSQCN